MEDYFQFPISKHTERTYYNGLSEGLSEMINDRISEYLEDRGYL